MRILLLTLLFCLLISLSEGATENPSLQKSQQDSAATNEQDVLKSAHISPYLIEWYIDINEDADLKHIWQSLGLEIRKDIPHRCGGGCTAETFDIQTAGEATGRTIALKLSFESVHFYQYLVFKRENSGFSGTEKWKFIGNIDSEDQRYVPPKHRIETGDDHTWLVVRELLGHGTGAIAYGEMWYEIKENELKEVLAYPVEGHRIPCQQNLGYAYKSLLLRHGALNGVYTVPVQFLASYNISDCRKGDDSPSLFAKGQKAYFVWNEKKERFVLDSSQSEITEEEIRRAYSIDSFKGEKFVEYNFSKLSEIARSQDAERKDWLRQFLTLIEDSPHKAALQRALQH